jgi:hypothetical protein
MNSLLIDENGPKQLGYLGEVIQDSERDNERKYEKEQYCETP